MKTSPIYAPVLIPTLNRYEHLKKCLESLALCTMADKTDVYVAIDFPKSDSHWEGYMKIVNYLEKTRFTFSSLTVIKRTTNLGVSKNGNLEQLCNEVLGKYDRYIISEDDNIFSPCFLHYMNYTLELYKNDMNVMAINGYTLYVEDNLRNYEDATVFKNTSYFSAWGFGTWTNRFFYNMDFTSHFVKRAFTNKNSLKRIREGSSDCFPYLMYAAKKGAPISMTDCYITLLGRIYDMYVISPIKSLVFNDGWDGSGAHCPIEDNNSLYNQISLPSQDVFNFVMASDNFSKKYSKVISNSYIYPKQNIWWFNPLFYYIKIFGYDNYLKLLPVVHVFDKIYNFFRK